MYVEVLSTAQALFYSHSSAIVTNTTVHTNTHTHTNVVVVSQTALRKDAVSCGATVGLRP